MDTPPRPVPVPEMDAAQLAPWLYAHPEAVRVAGEGQVSLALPAPEALVQLLELAQASGCEWVLLDGPRAARPWWVVDPWWSDRPESTPALLERVQSACVSLAALAAALQTAFPGPGSGDGPQL